MCAHKKHRQTDRHQLRLRRRSGERNHLMPADGMMEGGEERRGEARNQDDKTKCLSAVLKALISLYILSAPARPPYARLWGRRDSILHKIFNICECEHGTWIIQLHMQPKDVYYLPSLHDTDESNTLHTPSNRIWFGQVGQIRPFTMLFSVAASVSNLCV